MKLLMRVLIDLNQLTIISPDLSFFLFVWNLIVWLVLYNKRGEEDRREGVWGGGEKTG